MVSLTTYIKDELRVILWTNIAGKEYNVIHFAPVEKGDSVIVRELKAIILGLSHMNRPAEIEIYIGNPIVCSALNDWVKQWQKDGWAKKNGTPVKNKELYQKVMELLREHNYKVYLKGE